MKNLKVIVSALFLICMICINSWAVLGFEQTNSMVNFEKSKPIYEIDLEKKKIFFIDVEGAYMIDNDHIDVVMEGEITQKNEVVDISKLPKGKYILEITHRGFIFVDEIIIK